MATVKGRLAAARVFWRFWTKSEGAELAEEMSDMSLFLTQHFCRGIGRLGRLS